jgi:hypothetical protein
MLYDMELTNNEVQHHNKFLPVEPLFYPNGILTLSRPCALKAHATALPPKRGEGENERGHVI